MCHVCGVDGPGDPETGYSGDPICPECAAAGWTMGADGPVSPDDDLDNADPNDFGPPWEPYDDELADYES